MTQETTICHWKSPTEWGLDGTRDHSAHEPLTMRGLNLQVVINQHAKMMPAWFPMFLAIPAVGGWDRLEIDVSSTWLYSLLGKSKDFSPGHVSLPEMMQKSPWVKQDQQTTIYQKKIINIPKPFPLYLRTQRRETWISPSEVGSTSGCISSWNPSNKNPMKSQEIWCVDDQMVDFLWQKKWSSGEASMHWKFVGDFSLAQLTWSDLTVHFCGFLFFGGRTL